MKYKGFEADDRGKLVCSYHGDVTYPIYASEIPECAKVHKSAGCPLALTWKSLRDYHGYRG